MSSKEKSERENNVGPVIGKQDDTSGNAGNKQEMTGKEKQMGEAIYAQGKQLMKTN